MSLTEDYSFFNFSIFLDDYTHKFETKRRFSENIKIIEKKDNAKILTTKKKRFCSLKTIDDESENFAISNFYPKFETFISNEKLFSFSSKNEFEKEEENFVVIEIKKKICGKIIKNLKKIL